MKPRIVLIEDEKIISMLLNKMFENRGYTVVKMFDFAEEALDYIKNNKIDVVLLDIYLKGNINGIEAAKQIRTFSDTLIIYVTANADPATKEQAMQTDQCGYFEKPLSDNELDEICEIIKVKTSG